MYRKNNTQNITRWHEFEKSRQKKKEKQGQGNYW